MGRARATGVLLGLTVAAAVATLFGALAPLAWWCELFSHFRLQYAVLLAGCGLALLGVWRPAAALAALALAAANAIPLLHYYAPLNQPVATGAELKVVLVNVYFRNGRHERVLEYVSGLQPDVAVFLEVTPAWRDALRGLGQLLPYQAQTGELFVASRYPLLGLRPLPLADQGAMAVAFTVDAGGGSVTVVGAHANWPLGPGLAASRNHELGLLAAAVHGLPGPVLLLGDFNVTAFSPDFSRLLGYSGLADCSAGRGLHPTWPTWFPPLYLQIDHCLASAELGVTALATGPFLGSDHYPLEVTLRLREPAPAGPGGFRVSRDRPTYRR